MCIIICIFHIIMHTFWQISSSRSCTRSAGNNIIQIFQGCKHNNYYCTCMHTLKRLKWSALCVEVCKLIPAHFSADILFVNCAWLVCTKILTNSALCAKSHGVCFLQSAMTIGIMMRDHHDYYYSGLLHNLLWIFRANIESSYGHQVNQLRMQYTQEDKEVIEEFLKAKRSCSPKSETRVGREGSSKHSFPPPPPRNSLTLSVVSHFHLLIFNIIHAEDPLLTYSKHLDHEQLFSWICNHRRLKEVDYRQDIGKLKGIYICINYYCNYYLQL